MNQFVWIPRRERVSRVASWWIGRTWQRQPRVCLREPCDQNPTGGVHQSARVLRFHHILVRVTWSQTGLPWQWGRRCCRTLWRTLPPVGRAGLHKATDVSPPPPVPWREKHKKWMWSIKEGFRRTFCWSAQHPIIITQVEATAEYTHWFSSKLV